jgi:2-polyprenyl-3-methyl-5-hydroxy-6-metoxy-1,4-benzoquinol methylase
MVTTCMSRLSEAEWWETFSGIATKQWELTPGLNRIVRDEYLQEMRDHLFRPGGHLLEVGCGSGWAGLEVARMGMSLTGIDTSPVQIQSAKQAAWRMGLEYARFAVGTLSDLEHRQQYDSVLIHAVLHHLSEDEIERLLAQVRDLLGQGGRLYIYEPLKSRKSNKLLALVALMVFLSVWSPWWALHRLGITFKIGPPAFRDAVQRGWTGLSPEERPLEREWLLKKLHERYIVAEPRFWHAYSLAFAMGCSELPPLASHLAEWVARGLYWLDRRLLRTPLRDHIMGVWAFASICAQPKNRSRG